ncbi:lysozyme [Pseudophaeobacter arcticus]|uniref:lysozyme n=1 Tax=Pseudophaeobacter arcticus TaxID=385492 RepID=UPI0004889A06|nr:lysozyme [Pseudophaeobacter arcticus]
MKLISNWRATLGKSWSVWLILASLVLLGGYFLALVQPGMLGWDPLYFAIASATCQVLAIPARLVLQSGLSGLAAFRRDQSGAVRRRTVGLIAGSAIAMSSAIGFIGQWEGLRTEAYRDVVGIWTVCYGETKGVQPGDRYSKADCDAMLAREILAYEAQLDRCLTQPVPVGMKIALVSWTYNVGAGAACRSTLVRKANAGDLTGACNELPRWSRAGGRIIPGLSNRRGAERAMCHQALKEAA